MHQRDELPLVVVVLAVEQPDGFGCALADYTHDPARLRSAQHRAGARLPSGCLAGTRLPSGCLLGHVKRLKFAVFVRRHGVLELLPQEVLFDQHIKGGRRRVRVDPLILVDGARVLIASKHELFFLLALKGVLPGRQGHAQHDRHYGHGDQQRGHRIAMVPARAGRGLVACAIR